MEGAAGAAAAGRTVAGSVFDVDVNAAAEPARRASLTMLMCWCGICGAYVC